MIHRLVVHEIIKEQHSDTVGHNFATRLLDARDNLAAESLELIQKGFREDKRVVGNFLDDTQIASPFKGLAKTYLAIHSDQESTPQKKDEAFFDFTKKSTEALSGKMKKERLATGGHLLFVHFESGHGEFLFIILMSTKYAPSIKDLQFVKINFTDYSKFKHAGKVRFTDFAENNKGTLSYLSSKESADYFEEFLGGNRAQDPRKDSDNLVSGIKEFAHKEYPDDETERTNFHLSCYAYITQQERAKKPVSLDALCNHAFPGEPSKLKTHLSSDEYKLSSEFTTQPSRTKRLISFSFNANGLRLEWNKHLWKGKIKPSEDGKSLIIQDLPTSFWKQFEEESNAIGSQNAVTLTVDDAT